MAFYLVTARPLVDSLKDLEAKLVEDFFKELEPFGPALTASLKGARRSPDGTVVWEEEDYCRPPLAQERAAVLDLYFEEITVEPVQRGRGWERIAELPPLFPRLSS